MKSTRFAILCAAFVFGAQISSAQIASDNAGNYSLGWGNGDNQGSGFGPWEFENNNNNTDRFAGAYLATSNNPSGRNVGIFSPDPSGKAFILYAHPAGAFMNAKRNFGGSNAVPLAVGESFNFQWVQFWGNGDKGVNLYRSGWDDGNDRTISLRQNGDNFIAQPRGLTNSPVAINNAFNKVTTVKLRRAAPDTLVLTVQTDEAADGSYTNTFRSPAPDRVKFYYANGPAGGDENNPRPLFNNLSITADSVPVATRQVKFSVEMGFFEGQTPKKFDPANGDKVFVRGYPSGGWGDSERVELIQEPGTTVYSKIIAVAGDAGLKSGGYKFFIEKGAGSPTVVENGGFESISDREFDLPAGDTNLTVVYFNNLSSIRNVTYAVDMGVQIFKGAFNPATNGVELRADFNAFAGGASLLTREGTTTVYSGTFAVGGAEGSTNKFKFYSTGTNAVGYEDGADREAVLTANAVALNTGTNFFGNVSESRKITLSLDMSVQVSKGRFDPATNTVAVASSLDWGKPAVLAPAPGLGANVYSVDIFADGPLPDSVQYIFSHNGTNNVPNSGYEIGGNRSVLKADINPTNLSSTTLPLALFSRDDGIGPVITRTGLATINLTVGDSYTDAGATAVDAIDGSVTVTPSRTVDTTTAGTYTITYNASDAAGNAATPVTRTVIVAAADPLADYLGGFGLTGANAAGDADPDGDGMDNNAELAFGTDPTNGASRAATLATGTGTIKLVYLQRNSGVSYTVKSFTDLSTPFDSGGTPVTPTATDPQPAGIRAGYTQYEASLSTGSTRGFLRVKAVR